VFFETPLSGIFYSKRWTSSRSDVWSLGITLIEVSTGKFPYPKWNSVFEQLQQVAAPLLLKKTFSTFLACWFLLRTGLPDGIFSNPKSQFG
jgi:serine/threonine protein kinase